MMVPHSGSLRSTRGCCSIHLTNVIRVYSSDDEVIGFTPISDLSRTNSTTILMFLSNVAVYANVTTDPWFNATFPVWTMGSPADVNLTVYVSENRVAGLGCFENNEICRQLGTNISCAPLIANGSSLRDDVVSLLGLKGRQVAIMKRMSAGLHLSQLSRAILELNGASMLAKPLADQWASPSLPADQWTSELKNWFSAALIAAQVAAR